MRWLQLNLLQIIFVVVAAEEEHQLLENKRNQVGVQVTSLNQVGAQVGVQVENQVGAVEQSQVGAFSQADAEALARFLPQKDAIVLTKWGLVNKAFSELGNHARIVANVMMFFRQPRAHRRECYDVF